MRRFIYILCAAMLLTACSTQKNTAARRGWHQMKTIHNIYINGTVAYADAMETLNKSNEDDFTTVLNLYPVSNHKAAEAAASGMEKSIEKSRKCIKLHSIHAKPKINPRKRNNPKYQRWLASKEFNNQMWRAWLMLGQSEFHKGDFLGSVGTFNYISRLYENDPNIVALCQLWVARAYGEMGWIYEAEDLLAKVQVDDLKRKYRTFYSAVSADILLKGQHHHEAIPFVRAAKIDERRKEYRPRFEYVLGQLYQEDKQYQQARSAYRRCYRLHPKDVTMEFNARIHYAELTGDTTRTTRKLARMAKLYKYRDVLDQLYGAIGNIYLMNHDTTRALEFYEKGIEKSTKNGMGKAVVLLAAGDLYYERHDYMNASPCYKEAVQILSNEHPDYKRVLHRSEVLDEVVAEENVVQLQDSLQYLGSLSEDEQRAIVEKIIADLIEKEKQDSIQLAQSEREAQLEAEGGGLKSVDTQNMLGPKTGDAANWYFYNPQLIKSGKQEFARRWGTRVLEDNWRRLSKSFVSSGTTDMNDTMTSDSLSMSPDSLKNDSIKPMPAETDIHKPEYYLQQIPRTDEDYAASNQKIADALYNLIFIYRDRVPDREMSDATFEEFCRRFPRDERMLDLYYNQYLDAIRLGREDKAMTYKDAILRLYPESTQAKIVSDPNYFETLRQMAAGQDSLYETTYAHYTHSDFMAVRAGKNYAEEHYPMTPLMPRFLFLNAIAVAKTDGQEPFVVALQDMVERYPEHELSALAKDMLAMMGQGMKSHKGGDVSSLAEKRAEQTEVRDSVISDQQFSVERNEPSLVYIIVPADEQKLNDLLFQIALFNFSQFLIKDFDLQQIPIFTMEHSALQLSGFEGMDEAEWYIGLLREDTEVNLLLKQLEAVVIPITETNSQLLNKPYTVEDYVHFLSRKK